MWSSQDIESPRVVLCLKSGQRYLNDKECRRFDEVNLLSISVSWQRFIVWMLPLKVGAKLVSTTWCFWHTVGSPTPPPSPFPILEFCARRSSLERPRVSAG